MKVLSPIEGTRRPKKTGRTDSRVLNVRRGGASAGATVCHQGNDARTGAIGTDEWTGWTSSRASGWTGA